MRFVMYSLTIIFFCAAMTIVNTADSLYFTGDGTDVNPAQNRSLFGWQAQPFINVSQLPYVGSKTAFSGVGETVSESQSIPADFIGDIVDTGWTLIVISFTAFILVFQLLINTTINVGPFLNTLGRNDIKFFDDSIALVISIGIWVVYLLGIIQWRSDKNLKEGA